MANRKRNIQVKFYVTAEEKELMEQKMAQLQTKRMGAYLRKMAIDGYIIQVCALVNSMAACPFKFNVGGLGGAAEGGHQQFPIRLVGVADIVNGRFQR